ncbi:MAG: hypothetical protein AAGH46_12700, partial [Bacteroidota bacterium]
SLYHIPSYKYYSDIYFNSRSDNLIQTSTEQIDDQGLTSFKYAFHECLNMNSSYFNHSSFYPKSKTHKRIVPNS